MSRAQPASRNSTLGVEEAVDAELTNELISQISQRVQKAILATAYLEFYRNEAKQRQGSRTDLRKQHPENFFRKFGKASDLVGKLVRLDKPSVRISS